MKKLFILCIAVPSIFVACSKDEPSTPLPGLSATIDGSGWTSDARVTVLTSNTFVITATSLDGKSLAITIFGSNPDTYTLIATIGGSTEFEATYKATMTSNIDPYIATSGEVVLSSVNTTDHKISGTFHFAMIKGLTETINVTNGKFTNITYTISNSN